MAPSRKWLLAMLTTSATPVKWNITSALPSSALPSTTSIG